MNSVTHNFSLLLIALVCIQQTLSMTLPKEVGFVKGVPTREIAMGVHMPMAGMGTWMYNSSQVESTLPIAFSVGYTHVDTAFMYGNLKGIANSIKSSGMRREDIFITSKVDGGLNYSATIDEAQSMLNDLNTDYFDLLLVHFPATMAEHPVGGKAQRQDQWHAMEFLVNSGFARSIGVSHFCKKHIDDLLEIASIIPAVNQVQYHVGMGPSTAAGNDDKEYFEKLGITYQSFSPLCGPCGTKELLNGPLVTGIGAKYNKTGAQVSLKWLVQQGIPVIPKSHSKEHLEHNLDLFSWELSEEDMDTLSGAKSPAAAGGPKPGVSGDCLIA